VISPADLAARHTDLDEEAFAHLQTLMASWGVLSDLSFSDLLLLVPLGEPSEGRLVVLGQIRPTTGATLIRVDLVGHIVDAVEWPGVEDALQKGEITQEVVTVSRIVPAPTSQQLPPAPLADTQREARDAPVLGRYPPAPPGHRRTSNRSAAAARGPSSTTGEVPVIEERAQLECLPVRFGGAVVAVVARMGAIAERRTGRLERVYRDLYRRLAVMTVSGDFPWAGEEVVSEDAPRVGDGLLVTDSKGRVSYSSPNAVSALHRMGVSETIEGRRLSEVGVEDGAVATALITGKPVIEEVERRPDVIVLVHCTPLLERGSVTGAMVLLRDVTDLRRLDRLLLSKDAAIREVHHRVKNNLQTISSLLRLQARRVAPGKGREALREAERRVRSIAVVHEILSRDPGDQVAFSEIVEALVRMTEDSVVSGRKVRITVTGEAGDLSADMATPLAVALAELLQNAVEHGFPDQTSAEVGSPQRRSSDRDSRSRSRDRSRHEEAQPGNVWVTVDNDGRRLKLEVRDDGVGLPPGFGIDDTSSLGLSIVRDLVRSQLAGTMSMQSSDGTIVTVEVPLAEPAEDL
jgi:two-component system, sensor histidine kinase PdtaS